MRGNSIPYLNYMANYQSRGISELLGRYRFILDPQSFITSTDIYSCLPDAYRSFIAPNDGATAHIFNFNFFADCHKDTKNRGVTSQIKYGNDSSYLCFPTLGLKILLRHGAIVCFKDNRLEHYVIEHPTEIANPPLPRYVHTNHTPSSVLSSYENNTQEWNALRTLNTQAPQAVFMVVNALHT